MNEHKPGDNKQTRDRAIMAAVIGAIIGLVGTVALFLVSSTSAGHERDRDVKQQLVESISTAVSDATSYAEEIGSGEIVYEATSSQPASAVIQQRFDQAWVAWRQERGHVQLEIDTYFNGSAKMELDAAWGKAAKMVEDLILLSGSVNDRHYYLNSLKTGMAEAHQGSNLTTAQWYALENNPCYVEKSCSDALDFKNACFNAAQDIQTYLTDITSKIQQKDTFLQPLICIHLPICNW